MTVQVQTHPHILQIGKTFYLYSVYFQTQYAIKLPYEDLEEILLGCETANPFQQEFLTTLYKHVTDEGFDVARCAELMNIHRSTLFKNVKEQYGVSPNIYIQRCRLEIAKHMLPTYEGAVGQLAIEVGFDSLSYFTRCFVKRYKVKPSDLLLPKCLEIID